MAFGNPGTIAGALIGLKINGEFVSCETSCDFSFDQEVLAASPTINGSFKEFITGIKGWQMTVNGNLLLASVGADIKKVLTAVMTGETMELEFATKMGISPYLIISGTGIPQSGGISAPGTGRATWNVTFQGTGPFTTDYEEFYLWINAMPIEADYPIIFNSGL